MTSYHHTDTLGQALIEMRAGYAQVGEHLDQLEAEVNAERESHRNELDRMLERAEKAELERDDAESQVHNLEETVDELGGQLEDATSAADDAATRVNDLETEGQEVAKQLAAVQEVAVRYQGRALKAEQRIADLENERDAARESLRTERERALRLERALEEAGDDAARRDGSHDVPAI